jgi:DtxR family manganese transport transcriptional regulator
MRQPSTRSTSTKKSPPTKNQHESVRKDHATETAQDYVEAIDDLIAEKGECRLVEIARRFAVSHVTANRTIARLKRDGFVQSEPYGPISLTASGRRMAIESRRRHEIVLRFLKTLGVREETAILDAEGMEHHVSEETLQAMERYVQRESGEEQTAAAKNTAAAGKSTTTAGKSTTTAGKSTAAAGKTTNAVTPKSRGGK